MSNNACPHKANDSVNQIILEGRLGQDPDIKLTKKGIHIAKFPVLTSTLWQDGMREWHQQNHWHNIVVSRESTVRWIKDVLKEGDRVRIKGTLIYRHWKDRYGVRRRSAQVIVSDEKGTVEDLRSTHPQPEYARESIERAIHSERSNGDRLDLKTIKFLSPHPPQQPKGKTP